jgi:hypothetical protein
MPAPLITLAVPKFQLNVAVASALPVYVMVAIESTPQMVAGAVKVDVFKEFTVTGTVVTVEVQPLALTIRVGL